MTNYKISLDALIKEYRYKNELSREALAVLLGMPPKTLEGIEYGRPFRYERMLRTALVTIDKGLGEYDGVVTETNSTE